MVRTGIIGVVYGLSLFSAASAENITSDSYFYGQSPPVYPAPDGKGTGSWATAYEKAREFVANLSPEEKVNLTAGVELDNGCMGNIPPIPRVGFPGVCLSDAGNGLRDTDYVNGWSSGIHVGASWNKDLARDRGMHMGQEFRHKGVHVLLGPVVGPIGRVATGGRNWEGFSSDPYHTGVMGAETIKGMQSRGVSASIKHYIGNEQELYRNPEDDDQGEYVESLSSNIDDKTIHELYLWPFQDAVRAGSASVMCSYERINNSYGCQNSKTLNGILKGELGFQGYVVTDWGGQHSGIASANAGLDMVMPSTTFWGSNLTDAINNGTMDASRLDDMATRIIASWYQLGQDMSFPPTGIGMPSDVNAPHERVIATYSAERETLLKSAIEGHVLAKNNRGALPLQGPRLLSVFGYDAKGPQTLEFNNDIIESNAPRIQNHTLWVGGGSGYNSPAYLDAPIDALQRQAWEDGSSILWDFDAQNPIVDPTSDACLVFINAYASESFDRPGLTDEYSDTLVKNVASKCNNTMVIIHNAGIRLVDPWVEHENVTAVIFAHLPGQDTGRALVDLLYGRANPSGRLPYTVAKKAEDYGSLLYHSKREGKYWLFPQSDFSEGLLTDYRAFDAHDIAPRYEFGYGLSYTTFDYSNLRMDHQRTSAKPYPQSAPIVEGGNPHLWDEIVTVSTMVSNTGTMDGDEVVQLYVGIPNRPVRQLRGFEKVRINAGETSSVAFRLNRRDLSVWDVTAQQWHLQKGKYKFYVGRSSRDLPLQGDFTVA